MEVLESTEKMNLGLQGRAAVVAAASKRCFSSAVKQPVNGLLLSNSLSASATGLARTPAKEHAPFGIAVNTSGPVHDHGTSRHSSEKHFQALERQTRRGVRRQASGDSRRPNRQARAVSGGGWRSDFATRQLRRPNVTRRGWHAGSEPPLVHEQIQAAL